MKIYSNFGKLFFFLTIFSLLFLFAFYIAKNFYGTDFPVYYEAAKKIIDPQYSIKDIYKKEMHGDFEFPEKNPPGNYFIYSPIIAVFFSPLGFLPYHMAKGMLIFVNIITYGIAIALLLKQINRLSWFTFISAVSFTWMPFLVNLCVAQVNAIILLLIVGAVYLSQKRMHYIAGSLLSFAAFFKIFPLIISLIIGFSDRKITLACFFVFILPLIFPLTWQWFDSIPTVSAGFTPVYIYAEQYGIVWQILFSFIISFFSLWFVFRSKVRDLLTLSAYSVPVAFVAMPIIQYHHFLILSISYIIIFFADTKLKNIITVRVVSTITIFHINLTLFSGSLPSPFWSMILMWVIFSWGIFISKTSFN